jgi:hypothetical protein
MLLLSLPSSATVSLLAISAAVNLVAAAAARIGHIHADSDESSVSSLASIARPERSVASPTSGAPTATESLPGPTPYARLCNNYAEFCDRKYSKITEVGAHNSPFALRGSIASNQAYGVLNQLNDGVRMRK